jgi:protein dithiol oxidoreductase (disulfide-forming)
MNRRHFSARLAAGGLALTALGGTGLARAQGKPVEGTHYVKLAQPVPVPPGKIEVVEFFWYGCPHCNAFEPLLETWIPRLPADVAFRRVPVAFRDEPFTSHQKIYYALETMGLLPSMHRKVFYAIHGERLRLDKPADIEAFMVKHNVDGPKFMENFNSFTTQTKVRQATKLAADYKIDGVPALGIQGRYFTSGTLAGSPQAALAVTEYLIGLARKG